MRYCVFSDIHGNLEAFEAVSEAFSKEKADSYICLGDVVGYGADPCACIKAVSLLSPGVLIAGNHEWGVLGLLGIDYFNEYAAAAIEWTRGVLGERETAYLRKFRLTEESGNCTFVHGSLDQPARFGYVLDEEDAGVSIKLSRTEITFVGHSHVAGVYYLHDGRGVCAGSARTRITRGVRCLVNVGSVGQPRDGDPRASYAIYDDEESVVEIKRVGYDIASAQKKILKAGLPRWLASRLSEGR